MAEWWSGLTIVNQAFYSAAAFFSVFFIWQMAAALIGLGGDEADADSPVESGAYDDFETGAEADSFETIISFQILSIRSILTFFTLFTWGSALYLNQGRTLFVAMGYSIIWGMAGMLSIALVFYGLKKFTETGTINLNTCIGKPATVYLDIAENGLGEIRVTVSGVVSHVRARTAGGKAIKSGTPVKVIRRLNQTTVEVEQVEYKTREEGNQ